ncbi:MAG: ABC transporter substrate-binding protein, partial [Desulfobacterales bacterium]|nr:ABC transporter substrate-binding protein [Desulfobacterales bacterium]
LDREIIGVSKNEAHPPAALRKPVFSYHDDAERFLAARPDLVLVRPMIDRGYPQLTARLEKSGIAVVSLQPGAVGEMFIYWKILGILTGKQARAAEMTTRFRGAVSAFNQLSATLEERNQARKRVYFEAIHDRMKTFVPGAMAIFALEAAGGVNVARDAKSVRGANIAPYGKERILSRGAGIDVYLAQRGPMNRPTVETIKNEPGFSVIKAVQNDQVFIIDEMIVSRPTPRLLNGIYEIGCILYPDVFRDAGRVILEEKREKGK